NVGQTIVRTVTETTQVIIRQVLVPIVLQADRCGQVHAQIVRHFQPGGILGDDDECVHSVGQRVVRAGEGEVGVGLGALAVDGQAGGAEGSQSSGQTGPRGQGKDQ